MTQEEMLLEAAETGMFFVFINLFQFSQEEMMQALNEMRSPSLLPDDLGV